MKKIEKASGKTPKALQERPKYDPEIQEYVTAFKILNQTRKNESAISLSDIFLYADSISDNRLEFAQIILCGEDAFQKASAEKAEINDRVKKPR